jgi:hypothetical protein
MHDRAALKTVAWRAAVSAIVGLLVAAFAVAALAFDTGIPADGRPIDRAISGSLAPVVSAFAGAGSLASLVVFVCLVANDFVREAGSWLVAQRGLLLGPFRAIAWLVAQFALAMVVAVQFVIRSTVVVEAVWLVRTVGWPVVLVLGYGALIGLCAIVYVGIIVIGFACIGESTRFLVATLDDPPRQFAMALSIGGATALMYVGVGALALSLWLAFRVTRAGMRRAAARWPRTAAS